MAFGKILVSKLKQKKYWIPTTIVVVLIIFGVTRSGGPKQVEFSSTTVERVELVQSVEETGSVEAEQDLSYGWEISGRVSAIYADVGDVVTTSQMIAELENTVQQSRLNEATSLLAAAQAQLNLRLAGASQEEIATSLAAVQNAEAAYQQVVAAKEATRVASENAISAAQKSYAQAETKVANDLQTNEQTIVEAYEDAVQEAKDSLTVGLDVLITIADLQETYDELSDGYQYSNALAVQKASAVSALLGATTNGKRKAEILLAYTGGSRGEVTALTLTSDRGDIGTALSNLKFALGKIKDTSDITLGAMNAESEATATDKAALDTARTNLDAALAVVLAAQQEITSAELAKATNYTTNALAQEAALQNLENAQRTAEQNNAQAAADVAVSLAAVRAQEAQHAELIAPPRAVDVASLRADVARQTANVAVLQKDLEKTQLFALSNGTIAQLDVEIGETVTANQEVLGLVSDDLDIDVDISETDIAKVAINDMVEVTLDAFGDDVVYMGEVTHIEPAETEISGVIYYKTTVHLNLTSEEANVVRPGMTANVRIITDTKEDVLVIPRRAVINRDDERIVRVVQDPRGIFDEVVVTTGLSGDDGLIEIISGLREGDEVVTFLKE